MRAVTTHRSTRGHSGTNQLLLLETLRNHLEQEGGFVMFEGALCQPIDNWTDGHRVEPGETPDDVKTALKWVLRVMRRLP